MVVKECLECGDMEANIEARCGYCTECFCDMARGLGPDESRAKKRDTKQAWKAAEASGADGGVHISSGGVI